MNQTDRKIAQALDAKRQARDDMRRKLDLLEAEIRALESVAADSPEFGAPSGKGTRKARTERRLRALREILDGFEPKGLGVSDLTRKLVGETGEQATRGAVDNLLKRYTDHFYQTEDGARWRPKLSGGGDERPPP